MSEQKYIPREYFETWPDLFGIWLKGTDHHPDWPDIARQAASMRSACCAARRPKRSGSVDEFLRD